MKKTIFLALSAALVSLAQADHHGKKDDAGWVSLFDGKTLKGWSQKNGTATYKVENGTIVGTTTKGSPNSFLCTDKNYADFELEFEVKVDNKLNSGVQLRSQTADGTPAGRVSGPQCEIEANSVSGYIYGEGTKFRWLVPNDKRKAHKHFKKDEWNHFRVVAKGPRIQTWVNGQPICDNTHEGIYKTHSTGFIGLQVHGVGNRGLFTVAWRNIKVKELK